jgi:hypothetical protein
VDGHRRYADEPEQPSWYSGASPYETGSHERPSGAFRLPDQRPAERPETYDEVTSTGSHARSSFETPSAPARTAVRGPEYPAVRPSNAAALADTRPPYQGQEPYPRQEPYQAPPAATASGYNEPTSLVPPVVPAAERSVYSTRRPISAVVVAVVTALLMVPVVRLLIEASFAGDPTAAAIVPSVLLSLGLPMTGAGLYALANGGRPHSRETWLRPPVAYLPTGLFLILAAAIAVS